MGDAAIDEFNRLVAAGKVHVTYHPEDELDHDRETQAKRTETETGADGSSSDSRADSVFRPSRTRQSQNRIGGDSVRRQGGIREADQDENCDEEDDEDGFTSRYRTAFAKRPSGYVVPRERYYGNTGPKGVIADAQAYERALFRNSQQVRPALPAPSVRAGPDRSRRRDNDESDEANSSDLEEEDAFLAEWREKRMSELWSGEGTTGHPRINGRRVGGLQRVDSAGFLRIVEGRGTVVVFIYDTMSSVSAVFEEPLREIARRYDHMPFISITGEEAEIDGIALPGLLAYKNGKQIACLVPLVDYMPDDGELDEEMLEGIMKEHRILR